MMQLFFNLMLAWRAVRTNKLRSALTIVIIALGIAALVAILTSIEVLKVAVTSNFSRMGSNSFQVTSAIIKRSSGKGRLRVSIDEGKDISYDEAKEFKEQFHFPAIVGISFTGTGAATVTYRSEKTNPTVRVTGIDENYTNVSDIALQAGRNFSASEQATGEPVCILGNGTATKLFKERLDDAINQVVSVGNVKCRVVGVMESKGSSMMMNSDNVVLVPLSTARNMFGANSYLITVKVPDVKLKDMAAEEAEGLFRVVRKLPLGTANNFSVTQNSDLINVLLDLTRYIRLAAVIIGMVTLLGSVIGLMNIMLVSVAERTREIGVSKALGARSATIKRQFLTESILISLMGGASGVVAGMLIGNIISIFLKVGFVVPWLWITMGVSLCALVGVISGIYPAIKASKLDPIVALRYE